MQDRDREGYTQTLIPSRASPRLLRRSSPRLRRLSPDLHLLSLTTRAAGSPLRPLLLPPPPSGSYPPRATPAPPDGHSRPPSSRTAAEPDPELKEPKTAATAGAAKQPSHVVQKREWANSAGVGYGEQVDAPAVVVSTRPDSAGVVSGEKFAAPLVFAGREDGDVQVPGRQTPPQRQRPLRQWCEDFWCQYSFVCWLSSSRKLMLEVCRTVVSWSLLVNRLTISRDHTEGSDVGVHSCDHLN